MAGCSEIVFNAVSAISTLAAVVWAVKTSSDSITEIRKDRLINQSPFVAMPIGSSTILHKNQGPCGQLTNYGRGTAIAIECVWILKNASIFEESIPVELKDIENPNQRILMTEHSTDFQQLPEFLLNEDNLYTTGDGEILIKYKDSFGNNYTTKHGFSFLRQPAVLGSPNIVPYVQLTIQSDIEYTPPYEKS